MGIAKYVVVGLFVASPVIAQEHCGDADVDRIQRKILDLRLALDLDTMKGALNIPLEHKRYEPTSVTAPLQEQIATQRILLQECAESGNAWARYLHGSYLEVHGDLLLAISKDKTVLHDDPLKAAQAQNSAAEAYSDANKWFNLAASQGYALAMMSLGHNYAVGKGFVEDKPMAIQWFSRAANRAFDTGNRALPVICLKRMTALDPNHPLTLALAKALDDGATRK
jgi:hypothetical protein